MNLRRRRVRPIKPWISPGKARGDKTTRADHADGRAIQWLYCERKELPGSGDRAIDMATDGNMVVLPSICGAVGAAGFGGKESKVFGQESKPFPPKRSKESKEESLAQRVRE